MPTELSDLDRAIIEIEKRVWIHSGAKDQAFYDLGLSPTRAYQRLNVLIEGEAALAYAPATVRRLRERRARGLSLRRG